MEEVSSSETDSVLPTTCCRRRPVWSHLLTPLLMHTAAGLVIFTIAWSYTLSGYMCSLPLFLYLFIYTYGCRQILSRGIVKLVLKNIWTNMVNWFKNRRRSFILISSYWIVKMTLMLFYPQGETSNGSPLSLILFTALFIMIFIAPTVLVFLGTKCAATIIFIQSLPSRLQRQNTVNSVLPVSIKFNHKMMPASTAVINSTQKHWNKSELYSIFRNWRISIFLILSLTVLTYIMDGDVTSFVRLICIGKPCWPLLVQKTIKHELPYYLKYSWIKSWPKIFDGYQPHQLIRELLFLGREMEVIHTLPLLIGLFILSQLFLPPRKQFDIIRGALFGCISAVVLAGVTSGILKLFFHRYRPNAYGNPYYWTGPGTTYVNHFAFSKLDLSFPCGHTSVTSAIGTCLYLSIIHSNRGCVSKLMNVWLIGCLYFYPCLVMISRVSDCYHWASDGMFGIFLGYVIGNIVMWYELRESTATQFGAQYSSQQRRGSWSATQGQINAATG